MMHAWHKSGSTLQTELLIAFRAKGDEIGGLRIGKALAIDPDGRMYLNDQQLVDSSPETIRAAFLELVGDDRNLPVVLRADAQTPHHFVVTAMDVTGQMGFTRLSIATERNQEP